ncbi:MAG TPA: DUF5615 family PIN-like protein, partial [Dermatophilaceae bacterium]
DRPGTAAALAALRVRLLLDNNLSPRLVDLLTAPGWNVTHVRHLGLHRAPDHDVLQAARDSQRILVSADTDFGQSLARSRASGPSVVLVRRVIGRRVDDLAALLHPTWPAAAWSPSAMTTDLDRTPAGRDDGRAAGAAHRSFVKLLAAYIRGVHPRSRPSTRSQPLELPG